MVQRNDRTGARRRRRVRDAPVSQRMFSLHAAEAGDLHTVQLLWSLCLEQTFTYMINEYLGKALNLLKSTIRRSSASTNTSAAVSLGLRMSRAPPR
jgi:hypothetical protein